MTTLSKQFYELHGLMEKQEKTGREQKNALKDLDIRTSSKLDKVLAAVLGSGSTMDSEKKKKNQARTEVKTKNADKLIKHACTLTPPESQDLKLESTTDGMKEIKGFYRA